MAEEMFRPPVNRAMRVLDRSFFRREYPVSAARVFDVKSISRVQKEFVKSKDLLNIRAVFPVQTVPAGVAEGGVAQKCVLLRPEVKHDGIMLQKHEEKRMRTQRD